MTRATKIRGRPLPALALAVALGFPGGFAIQAAAAEEIDHCDYYAVHGDGDRWAMCNPDLAGGVQLNLATIADDPVFDNWLAANGNIAEGQLQPVAFEDAGSGDAEWVQGHSVGEGAFSS